MSSPLNSVLFFLGDGSNRDSDYQVTQWAQSLQRLATHCTLTVLLEDSAIARHLQDTTELDVVTFDRASKCRRIIRERRPRVILYPNRHPRNHLALSYSHAVHIFVSHGESDKAYMMSPGLTVFDVLFFAGEMAQKRLSAALPDFPLARTRLIGRPQLLDQHHAPDTLPATDRKHTVVYAPTWEGGSQQWRYGSVVPWGEPILRSLLSQDTVRVIYRPHPLTGTHLPEWAAENQRLQALVDQAASVDQSSGHFVDKTPFGWHLSEVDAMVSDVSAVAYDWLSTGKPLLVTKPEHPDTVIVTEGILDATHVITGSTVDHTGELVSELLASPTTDTNLTKWASKYFAPVRHHDTGVEAFIHHTLTIADEWASHRSPRLAGVRWRGLLRRLWYRVKLAKATLTR